MKERITPRVVILLALIGCAVAFMLGNINRQGDVWPFGSHPILTVILASFALGLGIGAAGHSLLALFRQKAGGKQIEGVAAPIGADRLRPGRP